VESVAASIRLADVGSSELRRREDSDDERLQMAYDAVDHIKERPLTGYGSWQQVMLFQSSLNNNDALDGVHSIPLQLGFEYGITGLILSGLFLIGLVSVSTGFAYYVDRTRTIAPEFVPSCMLWLITSTGSYFFGALMGLGRISVGFEMALVAWMGTQLLMTRHQRTHARASLRMGWKPARQPV
jgi:O-antigen ligase